MKKYINQHNQAKNITAQTVISRCMDTYGDCGSTSLVPVERRKETKQHIQTLSFKFELFEKEKIVSGN